MCRIRWSHLLRLATQFSRPASALIIAVVDDSGAGGGISSILEACVVIRGRTSAALSLALAAVEALFQYRVFSDPSEPSAPCRRRLNIDPIIKLNIDLMAVTGEVLKSNITMIGPLVLPVSKQILFALSLIGRKIINSKWKPYIPDFKQAFEHFCIHAGKRVVIDELQKNLRLTNEQVEASRMTLHKFGNKF
ncbi:hypothetical protein SASPL_105486 [Salvia splendens]|uniref:FAE domain-containing protein n=1 Tax=Salvia splendens TaxID=180675 RepID=A0A8X8YNP6_SALSN|nr:hypothetical protein SASPL_105486 [Salvia splendens]